ncbi:hypothetical protein LEP1GSC049_1324 [Leptospira kirschneri serovar Cynopteri str. 3522 CT]|uniref:Uncharacterized protein n=1 Tax=Leptospira kirschneri str. 200802841 TaxID=1193047 RepID=A0A828Y6P6_9LEPT|nr:hypothetical protein LEP1GSC044_0977 [Leptospira kirschneri serovar Grippotyphosa str. RM52]EKO50485.1 hypothetical protein LEP1GSC131_1135 [Leptospira kirschneri str. 200802841]EKQ84836.1 hypothetical protein LEP1GSC064_3014 [Leptospira kirschneri serovar Grippotyphosa str. Moskva]EKR07972.1 hypothetical protein LEP1GSC122_1998 [Leptospira kirschneri serovar Valbuzzi str. 200702274]EMK00218.1 hypothetical protein LEP1GSC176_3812 [Leptospira kirschneri str. MMD1493]EMN23898.1 hypothetical p
MNENDWIFKKNEITFKVGLKKEKSSSLNRIHSATKRKEVLLYRAQHFTFVPS